MMQISLIQNIPEWGNHRKSLERLDRYLCRIPRDTEILVLPEMFATGFNMRMGHEYIKASADETICWMQKISADFQCMVIGSMACIESNHCYNRCYCISPENTVHYDKRHLFSMSEEPLYFSAGTGGRQIIEWQGWRIRIIICYDLRFPAWCRNNATEPYDILVCVASWPAARSDVWLALLKARAIENQSFVIGVNRTGTDGNKTGYTGNTIVYGPKGEVIGRIKENREDLLSVIINKDDLLSFRGKFPVLKDMDKFDIII